MDATLTQMANPKNPDKHKPNRMVRIPEAMALALEQMAAEQFNSLTEQVKIAVREYLERHQRMPKPGHAAHKRS
jgi:hypothetical protein